LNERRDLPGIEMRRDKAKDVPLSFASTEAQPRVSGMGPTAVGTMSWVEY
jgi:hypothetical protein